MSLSVTITQFSGGVTSFDNSDLRGTANYLIWLCGRYGMQVQAGTGGGSVIPVNPGGGSLEPLEFTVSDTTPIPTGGNSITLPQFIGYQLAFIRGGMDQYSYSDGTNTYYKWNKITGFFQCFGDATEGEQFALVPYK